MEIRLSILIATMPSRSNKLARLLHLLESQVTDEVEVIIDDSMDYNIGVKRNKLLERAKGIHIVFADDDDCVSDRYVKSILKATQTLPDCIGISGIITTNGRKQKQWHISKDYGSWYELNNVYYRTPNHISPVKREIALQAMFPEISFGEDAEYSKRILPLLKTEVKVYGNIYHYKFRTK